MIPTARNIPPTQPSARQDALYPGRGPSHSLYLPLGEGPRLPLTARIERAQFHRARSASKEGNWPLPFHPSEAARCASTGIVPGHPAPFFSILLVLRCAVGRGIRRWSRVGGGAFAHQRREFGEFVHPLV